MNRVRGPSGEDTRTAEHGKGTESQWEIMSDGASGLSPRCGDKSDWHLRVTARWSKGWAWENRLGDGDLGECHIAEGLHVINNQVLA